MAQMFFMSLPVNPTMHVQYGAGANFQGKVCEKNSQNRWSSMKKVVVTRSLLMSSEAGLGDLRDPEGN